MCVRDLTHIRSTHTNGSTKTVTSNDNIFSIYIEVDVFAILNYHNLLTKLNRLRNP